MKTNYYEVNFEYKRVMGDAHTVYYNDECGFVDPIEAFQHVNECKRKAINMWVEDDFKNFEIGVWYYDADGCMHQLITLTSKHGEYWA